PLLFSSLIVHRGGACKAHSLQTSARARRIGAGSSSSAQDGNCFARDHQLFIGWDHHGDPIPIAGNASIAARAVDRVALRIEFKAEETKLLNHRSPNRRSVLANSAGENQRSD